MAPNLNSNFALCFNHNMYKKRVQKWNQQNDKKKSENKNLVKKKRAL